MLKIGFRQRLRSETRKGEERREIKDDPDERGSKNAVRMKKD